jgi:hypothetical protein
VAFVMLRHNTPKPLLDRFIEIFNESFTRAQAKETYLASVAKFRGRVLQHFDGKKYFDPSNQQFSGNVTAQLVKNKLEMAGGTVSRCEFCHYSVYFLSV